MDRIYSLILLHLLLWVNFCFLHMIECVPVVITFLDNGTLSCSDTQDQRDVIGHLFGCQRQQAACACACWRRTQAMLPPQYVFVFTVYTTNSMRLSVCTCANARREKGLCLWGLCISEMTVLSHFFRLPLRVLLNTRNVIWRCCSDPFLLRGGNSLHEPVALYSFGCSGTL